MKSKKEKRRALVTGSTRGIGFEIAKRLLKDGLDVISTGTQKHNSNLPDSEYYQVDYTDNISFEKFVNFIKKAKIDILINNVGINKIGKFAEINIDDFDKIYQVNLRAPFILCQAVIPNMKFKKWGRIINISSIFGHISKEYRASYSSSKFGLNGMTIALSAELSEFGILANCVGPGFIDTELTRTILGDDGIKNLKERIPIKRLGNAKEVASLVSFLASEENTYLTGQNLLIDGGFSSV